jgi:hypothetical protein
MTRTFVVLLGSVAVIVACVGPATAAGGEALHTAGTTCTMVGRVGFSPPISYNEVDTTQGFSGKVINCSGGGVSNGSFHALLTGPASCSEDVATGTIKVDWDTGAKSKASVAIDLTFGHGGTGTLTGQVLHGLFKGDQISASLNYKKINGNCADGINEAHYRGTLAF